MSTELDTSLVDLDGIKKVCKKCKTRVSYNENLCPNCSSYNLRMDFGDMKKHRITGWINAPEDQLKPFNKTATHKVHIIFADKMVLFAKYDGKIKGYLTYEIDYRDIIEVKKASLGRIRIFLSGFRIKMGFNKSKDRKELLNRIELIIEELEMNKMEKNYRDEIKQGVPDSWFYQGDEEVIQLEGQYVRDEAYSPLAFAGVFHSNAILTIEKEGVDIESNKEKFNKFINYNYISIVSYRCKFPGNKLHFLYPGGGIKIKRFNDEDGESFIPELKNRI